MRVLTVAAVVALALASGCVGQDDEPIAQAVSSLTGPSEEELARTPGVLQGIVHTPSMAPIFPAFVTEARLGVSAATDGSGFFRLAGLVTGEHLLTVTAEGFATRSVVVRTLNGTTLEVNVSLEPAPRIAPYVETRELQGFLACAARVAGEAHDCASADPNHRDIFEFELAPQGKGVVLELVWDAASTPAAPRMTLLAETAGYGAQDLDLGNATGSGYARVAVPQAVLDKYYPEGGLMRAIVALADGDAPAALALQSDFVVYVSVFYHEPGPEGYSVLSAPPPGR